MWRLRGGHHAFGRRFELIPCRSVSPRGQSCSIGEPYPELDLPLVTAADDLSKIGVANRGDRVVQLRSIESILKIRPDLQFDGLRNALVAVAPDVEVSGTRPAQIRLSARVITH